MSTRGKLNPLAAHRVFVIGKTLRELAAENDINPVSLSMVERGYFHMWKKKRAKYAAIYGLTLEDYDEKVKAAHEARKKKEHVQARESA
jgi:transcriptional regulator with XRE-family HTH domain